QDSVDVGSRAAIQIVGVGAIGQQASALNIEAIRKDRWQSVMCSHADDQFAIGYHEVFGQYNEARVRCLCKCIDRALDIAAAANLSLCHLQIQRRCGKCDCAQLAWHCCIVRIEKDRDVLDRGRDLFEQLEPLASHRELEVGESSSIAAWSGQAFD